MDTAPELPVALYVHVKETTRIHVSRAMDDYVLRFDGSGADVAIFFRNEEDVHRAIDKLNEAIQMDRETKRTGVTA